MGNKQMIITFMLLIIMSLVLVGSTGTLFCQGKDLSPLEKAIRDGSGLVVIIPSTRTISLQTDVPPNVNVDEGVHPFRGYAEFTVDVRSILPVWGATLEISSLEGPGGMTGNDLLWVRTEATGGEFVPINHPVPIVSGDFHKAVEEMPVEILFRPLWADPIGEYSFRMLLRPYIPVEGNRSKMTDIQYPRMNAVDLEISGGFNNPEAVVISVDNSEINFEAVNGPGTYNSIENFVFRVWTNANQWKIDCVTEGLSSEEGWIPLERISWDKIDDFGRIVDSGNLSDEPTILRGYGPATELKTTISFKIDVTMGDIAGVYQGEMTLMGSVE